jgi:hypothetical protein
VNLVTIEAAIKAAVASCSGVADVRWVTDTSKMRGVDGMSIDLRRSPLEPTGHDERRRVTSGGAWNATQVGQRVMRVTVRAESTKSAPDTGMDALGRLRTRIYRPAILSDLREAGLSLQNVGPIADYDASTVGRSLAAAACELVFNVADTYADGADPWIETVNGTATLSENPVEFVAP